MKEFALSRKGQYWSKISICLLIVLLFSLSSPAFAQLEELEKVAEEAGIGAEENLPTRIGQIISITLSILGVILVIILIIGGIVWMTAAGNPEQLKKAKAMILNAVIGLIVVLLAYAIASFLVEGVTSGLGGTTGGG